MACVRSEHILEKWISGHLYYHQSLDLAAQHFVHPLIVSLLKAGYIEAFFFVRYSLGGPHIRLRVRPTTGCRDRTLEEMQRSACRFLNLEPSTRSVAEDVIRRANERILAGDPNERDNSVYPDNSFRVTTFHPEIDRYGGPERFQVSLDFFTLSSIVALEFLAEHRCTPRSVQLAQAFCLLLQQALCFAADRAELSDLLGYAVNSFGETVPGAVEKGDEVARLQRHIFLQLFRNGVAGVSSVGEKGASAAASDFLMLGARRLSTALGSGDCRTRARIGGSHLHMTATRLGLSNAEEVYLSRLLTVTLGEVLTTNQEDLPWLGERPQGSTDPPCEGLGDLLPSALATLVRHGDRQTVDQYLETAAASCGIEGKVGGRG